MEQKIFKNMSPCYKTKNNWVCKSFVKAIAKNSIKTCIYIYGNTFHLLDDKICNYLLVLFWDTIHLPDVKFYYSLTPYERAVFECMYNKRFDIKDDDNETC